MKTIKYLLIIVGLTILLPSCFEEDTIIDQIEATPNLVGFDGSSQALSAVTDGSVYDFNVPVKLFGPTASELSGSVTANVSIDTDASTAIAGTHYNLPSTEITLSDEGDFLGVLPIEVLTEGIVAPLPENPVLVLNIEQVSGNSNVIASGKSIVLNFFYLCYSDLSGTYLVTIDHARCNSDPYAANFPLEVTIKANTDGSWHLSSADGGFLGWCTGNSGLANYGDIVELCGVIQPSNKLEYGSLDLGTITGGSWNPDTGTLILNNTQSFTGNWPSAWTSTYVRQ